MIEKNFNRESSNSQEEIHATHYDMVVFCHLRWQFVYQRPQHVISRMATDRKVLFVEEPIGAALPHESKGNLMKITDNLHVLQPRVNAIPEIASILPYFIANENVEIGWFYSASFTPLLNSRKFNSVVYDCMDELTLFKNAPQELVSFEEILLAQADIVFTGGKSLYESKNSRHKNVSCFPSSVDQEHFAKAKNGIDIPADIASIPKPIVGYFGVIDERIDFDLIAETAQARPEISFVMIGPLAKISEEDLPRAKNLHYLGMKQYTELPAYIKAFSIAMMPFALNDATKYISPTKTLEYMAAGKPIISTGIVDVVRDYSTSVSIIDSTETFVNAIDSLISSEKTEIIAQRYDDILQKTSWNNTVSQMEQLINRLKS